MSAGMPYEVVRLRYSTTIVETDGAITFSSWNATVHLRGDNSAALWHAIGPSLAVGISEEALIEALPEGHVRRVVADLLEDLRDNYLLELVDDSVTNAALSEDVVRWVGSKTIRAAGVLKRLSRMVLTISGKDARLMQLVHSHLVGAGLSAAVELTQESGVDVQIRIGSGAQAEYVVIIQTAGTTLVGPLPASPDITAMLLLANRQHSAYARQSRLDEVTPELAAAQALLTILTTAVAAEEDAHLAPTVSARPDIYAVPKVYVTDSFAVSELHPLTIAWPRSLVSASDSVRMLQNDRIRTPSADGDPPSLAADMETFKALWDRHGGAVSEPHPQDLPQIPYALAMCRDLTTGTQALGVARQLESARWDAFRYALRAPIPAELKIRIGLGRTRAEAREDAVLQRISSPTFFARWDAATEAATGRSSAARRAWSTLTLRLGASIDVDAAVARAGSLSLYRVRATDGARRVEVYSGDQNQAVTGALIRLGGLIQATRAAVHDTGAEGTINRGIAAPAISLGPGVAEWGEAIGLRISDIDSGQASLFAAVIEL